MTEVVATIVVAALAVFALGGLASIYIGFARWWNKFKSQRARF